METTRPTEDWNKPNHDVPKQENKKQVLKRSTRTGEKEDKHYSPIPYISPNNKNTTATTHTHHYRQLTTT